MALRPERPRGNLPNELLRLAEMYADTIEQQLMKYARKKYGSSFRLERFTELDWNVLEKKTFFSSSERMLDKVFIPARADLNRFPQTNGYCLMASFAGLSNDEILNSSDAMKDAVQFCYELKSLTNLPVRAWAGSLEFRWKGD